MFSDPQGEARARVGRAEVAEGDEEAREEGDRGEREGEGKGEAARHQGQERGTGTAEETADEKHG